MIENRFPCELGDGGRIDHGDDDHHNAKAVNVAAPSEEVWSRFDRQSQQPIRMQDLVVQCKRR